MSMNSGKRVISFILMLTMLFTLLPGTAVKAYAAEDNAEYGLLASQVDELAGDETDAGFIDADSGEKVTYSEDEEESQGNDSENAYSFFDDDAIDEETEDVSEDESSDEDEEILDEEVAEEIPEIEEEDRLLGDVTPHTHTIGEGASEQTITFEPWTENDRLPGTGSYYLTEDVQLTEEWHIEYFDINLCLNGHTITGGTESRVITVSGATLNIFDEHDNNGKITGHVHDSDYAIFITAGGTINMYGGSLSGSSVFGGGVVRLYSHDTSTYTSKFNMYGGTICQNNCEYGDTVLVPEGCIFNMYGGTICDNECEYGKIVSASGGTFNMSGGTISDNTSTYGAVYINGGEFNLDGGTVSDNAATQGGGGVNVYGRFDDSVFNMFSGTISNNKSTNSAGGVSVNVDGSENSAVFNMSGGTISDNASSKDGGGVLVDGGAFNWTNGLIEGNTAKDCGGGICVHEGSIVRINQSQVTDNVAITGNVATDGGGIHLAEGSELHMTGGTISDNGVSGRGGGIFSQNNNILLDGNIAIKNNLSGTLTSGGTIQNGEKNNLCLKNATISIVGDCDEAEIGVLLIDENDEATNGVFTASYEGTRLAKDFMARFQSDNSESTVWEEGNELKLITAHTHTIGEGESAQAIIFYPWDGDEMPAQAGNYYLTKDIQLGDDWSAPEGTTNLCLNGHAITGSGSDRVITVSSQTLNIFDESQNEGRITGGKGGNGGGIYVEGTGTANMYGGMLCGNEANNGAGVFLSGTAVFNLFGGSIRENNASDRGAGVYIPLGCTFNMYDGAVSENRAAKSCGGVNIAGGTFNMSGGTISDNSAGISGGGVYISSTSGEFNMSDGMIIGNAAQSGSGGGVGIYEGLFNMTGGTIRENSTPYFGGGVFLETDRCFFNMSGGTISGNTARYGGGVYDKSGNTRLSGDVTIAENNDTDEKASNLCLENTTVSVNGVLASTALLSVTLLDANRKSVKGVFTDSTASGMIPARNYRDNFASDNISFTTWKEGDELKLISLHTHTVGEGESARTITFEPWDGNTLPTKTGSYYLVDDVQLSQKWTVPESVTIDLCLNGHKITGPDNSEVISINKNSTLNLYDESGNTGMITGGNSPTFFGGGVYLYNTGAVLNMYGGVICGNNAKYGGGVCVSADCTFNMYDGKICENTAESGSAVYVRNYQGYGTFNMYGGEICQNSSTGSRGSVCNEGHFYMYDGTISDNEASHSGGSVSVTGSTGNPALFEMYGGTISDNKASEGGGVSVNQGHFIMHDGTIKDNIAELNGGGVYAEFGSFTMKGGNISNNTARYYGGVYSNSYLNLKLSGNPTIQGNLSGTVFEGDNRDAVDSNLCFEGTKVIITGELEETARVGVTLMDGNHEATYGVFTYSSEQGAQKASNYLSNFSSDLGKYIVECDGNELKLIPGHTHTIGEGESAQTIIFEPWDGDKLPTKAGSYFLTDDIELSEAWSVPEGTTNLCLNGHTITGSGSDRVITISSQTLNIFDESQDQGMITGGKDGNGGGIYVGGTGTVNMYGGMLCGNEANNGAGVFLSGTAVFNLFGGSIRENNASDRGAGVYITSGCTFNMYDGAVSENRAAKSCGGVNIAGGTFNMSGGTISDNNAEISGGGVYISSTSGEFNMSDGMIIGNAAQSGGGGVDLYLGQFNMSGGTIRENSTPYFGGGVLLETAECFFNMSGGTISGNTARYGGGVYDKSGNTRLSGDVTIAENTDTGEKASNLCLVNTKVTIAEALSDAAKVNVSLLNANNTPIPGVFTDSETEGAQKAKDYIDNFRSDSSNYLAKADGDELKLSHNHSFEYSANGATITATCKAEGICDLPDKKATLTIAVPLHVTYGDEKDPEAAVTDENHIQGQAKVKYQEKTGEAFGEETETAPVDAGIYKASITLGTETASVLYTIGKADSVATAPTVTATYGQTLGDVTLTNPEGNTPGTWTWGDAGTTIVGDVGSKTFKANFTPTDSKNYKSVENADVTVTVGKAAVTVTALPQTIKSVESISQDKDKVSVSGITDGQELFTILLTEDRANSKIIPSSAVIKDAEQKDVTANYNISYVDGALTVREPISATITFKVIDGSWNDGTSAERTVALDGFEGDSLKLTAEMIPEVGEKPKDSTFKYGSWDVVPGTETEFENGDAITFTYSYVAKAVSEVTKAPTAKQLTYNETAQVLVVAGKAKGGTMQYALGSATQVTGEYTATIPKADEPGSYYVWYKVKGDKDHLDSAADNVIVNIAKLSAVVTALPQTIREGESISGETANASASGLFKNHSMSAITLTEDLENNKIIPSAAVITTADDKDVTAFYDITYQEGDLTVRAAVSATVTFKVVDGFWNDGTSDDKVVTLNGFDGDKLKLSADQIPVAGKKPRDNTYKAGKWDTVPTVDDEFAYDAQVVITYNYAPKEMAVVAMKPEANNLTYNGQSQKLVTTGKADGGKMQYALGTATEITGEYSEAVPEAVEPGNYYVWYMVKGDEVHLDSEAAVVNIQIKAIEVSSIALRAVNGTTMVPRSSQQLEVTMMPSIVPVKHLLWTTSPDDGIVTVTEEGLITIKDDIEWGDATSKQVTVTAAAENGVNASIKITVVKPETVTPVTGVKIDPRSKKENARPGDSFRLTAQIEPSDATDKTVTWKSTVPAVAEVGPTGIVTVKKTGTTIITVTAANQESDSYELDIVRVPVSGISIDAAGGDDYLVVGSTSQLTVTYTPAYATYPGIIWSSSDENVAQVDENGLVTPRQKGKVRITASSWTDPTIKAEAEFVVVNKDDELYVEFAKGSEYSYTGNAITPDVNVYYRGKLLMRDSDYTVSYKNNKNANDASVLKKAPTVKVTGKTIAASAEATFRILPIDIGDESLVFAEDVNVASGKTAAPQIFYGGTKLTGKDFYNQYAKEKFTSSRAITVTGKGNFTGEREIWINVKSAAEIKKLPKIKVKSFKPVKRYYNGQAQPLDAKEIVVVSAADKNKLPAELVLGKDFYITYPKDITNVGIIKVSVIGIGDYTGTVTKSYKIEVARYETGGLDSIDVDFLYSNDEMIEIGEKEYDCFEYRLGGVLPAVEVVATFNNGDTKPLVSGRDYKVTYANNKKATVANKNKLATATITFKGNYKNIKKQTKYFYITQAELGGENINVNIRDQVVKKADAKYPLSAPVVDIDGVTVNKSEYTVTYKVGNEVITKNKKINFSEGTTTVPVDVEIKAKTDQNGNYTGNYQGVFQGASYTVTLTDDSHDLSKAKVIIQKKGDETHKAVKSLKFTGKPVVIGSGEYEDYELYVYFGKNVKDAGKTELDSDKYTVSYSNNVKAGTATVLIKPADGSDPGDPYYGSKTFTFKIVKGILPWIR